MTENLETTVISAGTQSSLAGQLQPDAARDMARERRLLSCMQHVLTRSLSFFKQALVVFQTQIPGAKNGFLGVLRSEFTCVRTSNHGLLTLSE